MDIWNFPSPQLTVLWQQPKPIFFEPILPLTFLISHNWTTFRDVICALEEQTFLVTFLNRLNVTSFPVNHSQLTPHTFNDSLAENKTMVSD